jgi:hypothetical protein
MFNNLLVKRIPYVIKMHGTRIKINISLLTQTNKKEPANKEAWAETRRSTIALS